MDIMDLKEYVLFVLIIVKLVHPYLHAYHVFLQDIFIVPLVSQHVQLHTPSLLITNVQFVKMDVKIVH